MQESRRPSYFRGRGTPPGHLYVQLECLDPMPESVSAAHAPSPAPRLAKWVALVLLVAIIGIAALALGALLLRAM